MRTIKLPISKLSLKAQCTTKEKNTQDSVIGEISAHALVRDLQRQQNTVYRCAYAQLTKHEVVGEKELRNVLDKDYKFGPDMDSWFVQSMVRKAMADVKSEQALLAFDQQVIDDYNVHQQSKVNQGVSASTPKTNSVLKQAPKRRQRVFGGRKLLESRSKGEISKQEYQDAKLQPIYLVGEASKEGNRKFVFLDNHILFKPSQGVAIQIQLPKLKGEHRTFYKALVLLNQDTPDGLAVTVSLTRDFICLSYEETMSGPVKRKRKCSIKDEITEKPEDTINEPEAVARKSVVDEKPTIGKLIELAFATQMPQMQADLKPYIPGRYMGIDVNPNYIGVSFFNEKKELIFTQLFQLKAVTDLPTTTGVLSNYRSNKLRHEIREIAWQINRWCNHFQIQYKFAEDLLFANEDAGKGAKFNKLARNSFIFKELFRILNRTVVLSSQHRFNSKVVLLNAKYSSTIGNLMHLEHPDPVAASMEIARRGIENRIVNQEEEKKAGRASKFYPPLIHKDTLSTRWKDAQDWTYESWVELHHLLQKSGVRYRSDIPEGNHAELSGSKLLEYAHSTQARSGYSYRFNQSKNSLILMAVTTEYYKFGFF